MRNGVRLVAYGTGNSDRLSLASIPLSSDVKVGDLVVTSGLGQRFPAGFPIGRIVALRPDDSRAFLIGDVKPAAQLDRGRDVLLLRHAPARPVIGPATATPPGSAPPVATSSDSTPPNRPPVTAPASAAASGQPAGATPGQPITPPATTAPATPGSVVPAAASEPRR
jgi:rod shape-determining protein MreC